ncbi:hypothetical protein Tco_0246566 [Tanacetum coccineum]
MFWNMVYFENDRYTNTLKGSDVGTRSTQTLHGAEFEVEPYEDRGFEVEPLGSCDLGDGLQVFQTQYLITYWFAHDMEQCSVQEPLRDAIAYEVIFKWIVVMKGYMDTQSSMCMLSNSFWRNSDDSNIYYWKYAPDEAKEIHLIWRSSGLRVLSLEASLSGNHDEEKKSNGSCIYAVGSHEYQTVFVDSNYAMGRSITVMGKSVRRYGFKIHKCALSSKVILQHIMVLLTNSSGVYDTYQKEGAWLNGLSIESGFELRLVAGIATGALTKAVPDPRLRHSLKLSHIDED